MFKTGVFERSGQDEMTRSAFYFVIGCILAWGFTATSITAKSTTNWRPDTLTFLLVGLGIPIVGILLSISSNAFISFLGFNCVAIPMGAILGPALAMYEIADPGVVSQAATLTALVTAAMTATGLFFPDFYRSIGGALFGALSCLVLIGIAGIFIPSLQQFTIIHYIAAGIFALYIGYDMFRASEIPATLDNAVDVSISLYLDVINLFIRILAILGNKNDD